MPKKTRRSRIKYKAQRRTKPSAPRVSGQQLIVVPSRQAPVAEPQTTLTQQADRHRQVIAEVKRISLIGVILLALLVVLSFILR